MKIGETAFGRYRCNYCPHSWGCIICFNCQKCGTLLCGACWNCHNPSCENYTEDPHMYAKDNHGN